MNKPFDIIRREALEAYADSHPKLTQGQMSSAMARRKLDWRASAPVTRDEAIVIMTEICPSYNEFSPGCLLKLPKSAMVTLAREGSVCVYADQTGTGTVKSMKADEWHPNYRQDGLTRIWWD